MSSGLLNIYLIFISSEYCWIDIKLEGKEVFLLNLIYIVKKVGKNAFPWPPQENTSAFDHKNILKIILVFILLNIINIMFIINNLPIPAFWKHCGEKNSLYNRMKSSAAQCCHLPQQREKERIIGETAQMKKSEQEQTNNTINTWLYFWLEQFCLKMVHTYTLYALFPAALSGAWLLIVHCTNLLMANAWPEIPAATDRDSRADEFELSRKWNMGYWERLSHLSALGKWLVGQTVCLYSNPERRDQWREQFAVQNKTSWTTVPPCSTWWNRNLTLSNLLDW